MQTNKTYDITIPASSVGDIEFLPTTVRYKVLDAEKVLDKLTAYQVELTCKDNYFALEDVFGKIVVIKIKDEYIIEEIAQ